MDFFGKQVGQTRTCSFFPLVLKIVICFETFYFNFVTFTLSAITGKNLPWTKSKLDERKNFLFKYFSVSRCSRINCVVFQTFRCYFLRQHLIFADNRIFSEIFHITPILRHERFIIQFFFVKYTVPFSASPSILNTCYGENA